MPKVKFVAEKKEVEVEPGANLRQVAIANGVPVHHDSIFKTLLFDIPVGILGVFGIRFPKAMEEFPEKVVQVVNCHGFGHCGTCHVHIKKGMENCSPPGAWERFRLAVASFSLGAEDKCRLSCQTKVNGDIEVEVQPKANLFGEPFWQEKTYAKGAE